MGLTDKNMFIAAKNRAGSSLSQLVYTAESKLYIATYQNALAAPKLKEDSCNLRNGPFLTPIQKLRYFS
jgi:hypothetical protein